MFARVEVAISGTAGRNRCRFVDRSGRLTTPRRCAKPVWLKAKGTANWSLSTKVRLLRGTYTIQVRPRRGRQPADLDRGADAADHLTARCRSRRQTSPGRRAVH